MAQESPQRSASLAELRIKRGSGTEYAYGAATLQRLDYWPGSSRQAPLVVFVHGGGWKQGDKKMMHGSAKLSHWQEQGYAVVSLNYRLVPDATVEQQAADKASHYRGLIGKGSLEARLERLTELRRAEPIIEPWTYAGKSGE